MNLKLMIQIVEQISAHPVRTNGLLDYLAIEAKFYPQFTDLRNSGP